MTATTLPAHTRTLPLPFTQLVDRIIEMVETRYVVREVDGKWRHVDTERDGLVLTDAEYTCEANARAAARRRGAIDVVELFEKGPAK